MSEGFRKIRKVILDSKSKINMIGKILPPKSERGLCKGSSKIEKVELDCSKTAHAKILILISKNIIFHQDHIGIFKTRIATRLESNMKF